MTARIYEHAFFCRTLRASGYVQPCIDGGTDLYCGRFLISFHDFQNKRVRPVLSVAQVHAFGPQLAVNLYHPRLFS